MLLRILIGSHDPDQAAALGKLLGPSLAAHVRALRPNENLWAVLRAEPIDLLVVDEPLLGGGALAAIHELRSLPDAPEVVVLVEADDATHRAELLAAEAFAVINPDIPPAELIAAFQTIVRRRAHQAHREAAAARQQTTNLLSDLATKSPVMREFLALVRKVADTDSTLLVQGETGVGKEFLSRAIHTQSRRFAAPFVAVNCSALSESLLESELFGHVEGAFTGARRARRGYFELAHGGTLFIDEVGELSPQLQVKLLRVIQDRRIQPVGSEEEFEVDVRIIAATNLDLNQEMEADRFRPDLFYRLSVVTLDIPPLRLRREDIRAMVDTHVEHFAINLRRAVASVSPEALELLEGYDWPGNVRELVNVVERAVLLTDSRSILVRDLPEEIRSGRSTAQPPGGGDLALQPRTASQVRNDPTQRPFAEARQELLDQFEMNYLRALLGRTNGRVTDAARLAELNSRSLYEKMRRHGIRKEFFKLGS
ncbi:sigma-54 dependent transcriptional regulator [Engelhardtia mirabilis]|uniref:Transcriptional regulatory protein ZraR n=1 Tax=Engelhardtia mirabilis TaxID=2528011 RepID=A0A518BPT2_9BACT|nr:Transcriptional regulatory protein ZraR [Planctomycetes bacterium Pla133]QDV03302.1 Transcriptional regulatory protein ZraR [Planctomycetes bacterium Pla86]